MADIKTYRVPTPDVANLEAWAAGYAAAEVAVVAGVHPLEAYVFVTTAGEFTAPGAEVI